MILIPIILLISTSVLIFKQDKIPKKTSAEIVKEETKRRNDLFGIKK